MKKLIFLIPLITISMTSLLHGQSVKLSDREDFFFRQESIPVYPEDQVLGFIESRPEYREPFLLYIKKGAEQANAQSENVILLNKKYEQLGLSENEEYRIILSKQQEKAESYTAGYRIENEFVEIKGTYYLRKNEEKWFLYDVEIESQTISRP
jgi:hypothetical protein